MKKLLVAAVLSLACAAADAQIVRRDEGAGRQWLSSTRYSPGFRFVRPVPTMRLLVSFYRPAYPYWEGLSYTSFSYKGRIRSTHSFDTQGQLRETQTSFQLRRNGMLSNWRIQFSSQRTRPLFIFTIPR